jgi:hypothetical protein
VFKFARFAVSLQIRRIANAVNPHDPVLFNAVVGVFKHPIRNALALPQIPAQHWPGTNPCLAITPSLKQCNWPVQEVVPIPLSEKRQRERGYNQAGLIARPTSQLLDIDYRPNVLRRARHTRSQVGLTIKERETNVQNAFEADPTWLQVKISCLWTMFAQQALP